ncbi:hypothetical protein CDD82_4044 [Ophiocordyceps australis]|uniref:SCP domain-containing protein n=1 Tax=Ophiocordyceps australis TaxID=1399860 RepID=A0A2C5ZAZ5_9HYPO|nr:hypothetical protein CDD82_4044 [Ophiocordyceps australis]
MKSSFLFFSLVLTAISQLAFAAPAPADNGQGPQDNSNGASPTDHAWVDEGAFESGILGVTNQYRAQHGARALQWNNSLAWWAYGYLDRNKCAWKHSQGPWGENIACGYVTPAHSVQVWGDERRVYDYRHPGFSHETGHFTQLVWKGTTDVGCAREWCGRYMRWFVACEYWPPGNVQGQYAQNVSPQRR